MKELKHKCSALKASGEIISEDEHTVSLVFKSCLGAVPVYSAVITCMKDPNKYTVVKAQYKFFVLSPGEQVL